MNKYILGLVLLFSIPSAFAAATDDNEININQEDDHDEHQEEAHNEFYAKYTFECGDIKSLDLLEFPYFETFSNYGELEVQFVSEIGSTSFEVEADSPIINIEGKI